MPQSTSGHGHNTAPHVGPHTHSLAVQSQGPAVVQGHVHPPAPITSPQGQQQFQRLKVQLQEKNIQTLMCIHQSKLNNIHLGMNMMHVFKLLSFMIHRYDALVGYSNLDVFRSL